MERLTKKINSGYVLVDDKGMGVCTGCEATDKLGKLEDIEEQIDCPLEVLFDIVANTKTLMIDENKVGEFYQREKWKKVKSFIPDSFNFTYIFCDVWYEDNFGGIRDTLAIPIKQYKKTWWLKADKSEQGGS